MTIDHLGLQINLILHNIPMNSLEQTISCSRAAGGGRYPRWRLNISLTRQIFNLGCSILVLMTGRPIRARSPAIVAAYFGQISMILAYWIKYNFLAVDTPIFIFNTIWKLATRTKSFMSSEVEV